MERGAAHWAAHAYTWSLQDTQNMILSYVVQQNKSTHGYTPPTFSEITSCMACDFQSLGGWRGSMYSNLVILQAFHFRPSFWCDYMSNVFAVCRAAQWAARKCNRLDKQIRIYKELEVNQRCFCLIGGSLSRHRCTFNLNTKRWVTCDSWHVWQQWLQISQPSNFPVHRQSCTSKWWKCKGSRYCCHHPKKTIELQKHPKNRKTYFFHFIIDLFFLPTFKKKKQQMDDIKTLILLWRLIS